MDHPRRRHVRVTTTWHWNSGTGTLRGRSGSPFQVRILVLGWGYLLVVTLMVRIGVYEPSHKILFQFGKCRTIFATGVSRGKVFKT